MRKTLFFLVSLSWSICNASAHLQSFGSQLCKSSEEYTCVTIKAGETWETLWEDPDERDLVRRVNRTNIKLVEGMEIAIPKDLKNKTVWDLSPFPKQIHKSNRKVIIVDQKKLAWAIFDTNGELQWWGPISSGGDQCTNKKKSTCRTVTGKYYIYNKKSVDCISKVFPIGEGGARMPYCMYFYRGYALHGSSILPGYRDSHGCVRLFTEDAKWLNEIAIDLPNKDNNFKGTEVIVKELVDG